MINNHFIEGLKRTFPLFIGVIPFGLAYGISAKTAGLNLFQTVLMSLIVFAGAAQFIAIEMMKLKSWIIAILITTLVINLRHILMSLSLKPFLSKYPKMLTLAIAFGIIDETFAVSSLYFTEKKEGYISFLFSSAVLMYFGWVGSSFLGYVLGEQIQDPLKWGLDFAMPATFIGILIPQVRSRNIMNTVVSSAITATILKLILNNPIFILFGAIIGAFVGYKSERSGL